MDGDAEPSAASGECSEAEHPQGSKKSSKRAARRFFRAPQGGGGRCCRRLPLKRICAQYGFRFFSPEKSKFVASTAKRQEGLSRGKPGPPLPCFASFCRSKRKAPAASRTGFAPCKINAPPKATTNWPPPDRRIGYAFAKDSATPIGEMKLGIVCSVNPSVSLTAHNSPCTGEAFLRKAKQTR